MTLVIGVIFWPKRHTWVHSNRYHFHQSKSYLFSISQIQIQKGLTSWGAKKYTFICVLKPIFEEACFKPIFEEACFVLQLAQLVDVAFAKFVAFFARSTAAFVKYFAIFLPGPLRLLSNLLHFFAGSTPAGGSLCPTLCNLVRE